MCTVVPHIWLESALILISARPFFTPCSVPWQLETQFLKWHCWDVMWIKLPASDNIISLRDVIPATSSTAVTLCDIRHHLYKIYKAMTWQSVCVYLPIAFPKPSNILWLNVLWRITKSYWNKSIFLHTSTIYLFFMWSSNQLDYFCEKSSPYKNWYMTKKYRYQ
jgi:hypothetical protein